MSHALRIAAEGVDHPFGTVHSEQGASTRSPQWFTTNANANTIPASGSPEWIPANGIAQKSFPTGEELEAMLSQASRPQNAKASDASGGSAVSESSCPPMANSCRRPQQQPHGRNQNQNQNQGHELTSKGTSEEHSKKGRTLLELIRVLRQIDERVSGQEERLSHFIIEHEKRVIKAMEDALERTLLNIWSSPARGEFQCPGQSQSLGGIPVPRSPSPQNQSSVPLPPPMKRIDEEGASYTNTDGLYTGSTTINSGFSSDSSEVRKATGDTKQIPQAFDAGMAKAFDASRVATAGDKTTWETNAADRAEKVPPVPPIDLPSDAQTLQIKSRTQTLQSKSKTVTWQTHTNPTGYEYCELEIIEAQGLLASDIDVNCCKTSKAGLSDPYVKVFFLERRKEGGLQEKEIYKSSVQRKTLNPAWNAFCKFKVEPEDGKESIMIEIWDADKMCVQDDLLGRVTLKFSDIQAAGENLTGWFDLAPQIDCPGATGKILLKASLLTSTKTPKAYFSLLGAEANVADLVDDETNEQDEMQKALSPLFAKFQSIVADPKFDGFFVSCIVLNSISMMVELEYSGRRAKPDGPAADSSPEMESILSSLNLAFAIAFSIELLLRLAAFGLKFLTGHSAIQHWLDIIVVLSSVLEILGSSTVMNLSFLRLVRLSKLARLLRMMVMASFCDPLRILMKSIYTGFASLFWSFVLLLMIELVAGLFMTQMLADSLSDKSLALETRMFIYKYYGTTSRSILSMFQITMAPGAWGSLGRPLIEEVSPAFAWFFIMYVGGVTFAIIRIITALFLRQTLAVAANDDRMVKLEKIKQQRKFTESVRALFKHVAENSSGTDQVTFAEFQTLLMDEHVKAWLSVLELNPKNASYIFELIDNGDGMLTLDEFLSGVFRLKGTAQQIDMVMLQRETHEIKNTISKMLELTLSDAFNQVAQTSELEGH